MAKPKVFISSTCFDLGEVRDSLTNFIISYGFDPVLSEHGDVFFHPDLHSHEACLHEVGNCQLFILMIGGRFGGSYVNEPGKSITNAEYEAAVFQKIPVFTYIKRSVLDNHNLYQTNRNKDFAHDIDYPAIENQKHANGIFDFINRVRRAPVNNAYEPFDFSKDIENHLRKQWAGMFFDFLKNREVKNQIESTGEAVEQIKFASSRLEDLITDIYNVIDKENAPSRIKEIETISKAKKFLESNIGEWQNGVIKVDAKEAKRIKEIDPSGLTWYEYLVKIGILEITEETEEGFTLWTTERFDTQEIYDGFVGMDVSKTEPNKYHEAGYEDGLKLLNDDERAKLIEPYLKVVK